MGSRRPYDNEYVSFSVAHVRSKLVGVGDKQVLTFSDIHLAIRRNTPDIPRCRPSLAEQKLSYLSYKLYHLFSCILPNGIVNIIVYFNDIDAFLRRPKLKPLRSGRVSAKISKRSTFCETEGSEQYYSHLWI
jgi:hypothetical protein